MSLTRNLLAIGLSALTVCTTQSVAAACELQDSWTTVQVVTYIQYAQINSVELVCVDAAYKRLTLLPYGEQLPIYLKLLSSHIPPESEIGLRVTPPMRLDGFYYPAIYALVDLGPQAEPALLDYIAQDPERDRIAWQNAVSAVLNSRSHSYLGVKGVALFKRKRAELKNDPLAAERMTEAIRFLAERYCRNPRGADCQAAADSP